MPAGRGSAEGTLRGGHGLLVEDLRRYRLAACIFVSYREHTLVVRLGRHGAPERHGDLTAKHRHGRDPDVDLVEALPPQALTNLRAQRVARLPKTPARFEQPDPGAERDARHAEDRGHYQHP